MTGDLESRATALKPVERQLAEFEDLLGRWESAQAEAAKGLEQTLAGRGGGGARIRGQERVRAGAARVDNVQIIGSSRREIDETRALLEDTQNKFQVAEEALRDFEARKRALDRAEQRLARAEASRSASRPPSSLRRRRPSWTTPWSRRVRSVSR